MAAASDSPAATPDPYLLGSGGTWPDITWPNGARVAVSLVINYEEGAEQSALQGDRVGERAGEVSSSIPAGTTDLGMDQLFAYGLRAGYWRLTHILDEFDYKSTFLFCGRAVERTPRLAADAVARGHEAASHGYRWVSHALMQSPAEEEREIRRASAALAAAGCGEPRGFYCRWGPSVHTRSILARLGFEYDSNAYDDDLPYYDYGVPGAPMLVLPYSLDTNDWKFIDGDPWGTPRAYLDYLKCSLEVLLAEGDRGLPRMLSVGLHLRIIGRPGRLWALREFLEHLKKLGPRVWVARRIDIARHWRQAVPCRQGG
jgi:peptidoglycan/xylan/chitin deacetylase (PgdA/CDA1 family)